MTKKVSKTKFKQKTRPSRKTTNLSDVPQNVRDAIDCALFFENIIGRAVLDLRQVYPKHATQSAGLALALASLTHPESKRFAKMIAEVTGYAIKDFQRCKEKLMEAWGTSSKFLH